MYAGVVADAERRFVESVVDFRCKRKTVFVIGTPHKTVADDGFRRVRIEALIRCLIIVFKHHDGIFPSCHRHAFFKVVAIVL